VNARHGPGPNQNFSARPSFFLPEARPVFLSSGQEKIFQNFIRVQLMNEFATNKKSAENFARKVKEKKFLKDFNVQKKILLEKQQENDFCKKISRKICLQIFSDKKISKPVKKIS
jgi:hypothetical protein